MSNTPNKSRIVRVLTYETMDPDQLELYHPQFRRRGRSEYEAEHEYNPFRAYDDQVEVSCHRERRK